MKAMIRCSNGNPVKIRTGRSLSGRLLYNLGYRRFSPGLRYDITHTESPRVRLVKAYRYGDDHCDIHFTDADLEPLEAVGKLVHVPDDPAVRALWVPSLKRMLDRAVTLTGIPRKRTSIFDFIPPLYVDEDDMDFPANIRTFEEDIP